jgi:putative ABC transport system substrate-binding protein
MDRRAFVAGTFALLVVPLASEAQQPAGKVYRIGYLEGGSVAPGTPDIEAFRQGLRELGWIDGRNIVIEVRYAGGKFDQLPALAAELVRLKMDLIFTSTTPAALAVKRTTTTIPIVIGNVGDPVRSGLVASLAHPGGNITGWTSLGLDLRGKYFELLKEAVPRATRIGVLRNPANPLQAATGPDLEAAARGLKVQLHTVGVRDPKEFRDAFSSLAAKGVEALVVLPDGMFLTRRDLIIDLPRRLGSRRCTASLSSPTREV